MAPVKWTDADHARKLTMALDGFERAMARRWQRMVGDAIANLSEDFPVAFMRDTTNDRPLWNFMSQPAQRHIYAGPGMTWCKFIMWIRGGQSGPLGDIRCDGWTGGVDRNGPDIPEYVECGVGSILAQVEEWAWGERAAIFERLPLFEGLDLAVIKEAHDELVELGGKLGLAVGTGSGTDDVLAPLAESPPEARDIPRLVASVAKEDGPGNERQSWWDGWSGLEADWARAGFFASVAPTLNNQAGIAGSLANLYVFRAGIIEEGRNNGLHLVESATRALDETGSEGTNRTSGWKVLQVAGGLAVVGWHPVAAAVGSAVVLVGFLGENFLPEGPPREVPTHDLVEVIEGLYHDIHILTYSTLHDLEDEYYTQVNRLHSLIYGRNSFNLELYDFTGNTPTGNPAGVGKESSANLDAVMSIAKGCYDIGEEYEQLLPMIARTTAADGHLADKDSSQTRADKRLLELRDLLESFLKTTVGRYFLAGDQVRDAAERYVAEDDEQRRRFEDKYKPDSWAMPDLGFDPEEYAEETFRPGRPGERDDADYAVDGEVE